MQNIAVEIRSHSMIKEGIALAYPSNLLKRVGAYEISMKTPGYDNEMFRLLEDKAAFELRVYTDQALFCERPSHVLIIKNIVNS